MNQANLPPTESLNSASAIRKTGYVEAIRKAGAMRRSRCLAFTSREARADRTGKAEALISSVDPGKVLCARGMPEDSRDKRSQRRGRDIMRSGAVRVAATPRDKNAERNPLGRNGAGRGGPTRTARCDDRSGANARPCACRLRAVETKTISEQ